MEIRALVFDFDGLILDTESSEFETVAAEFAAHGHELPLVEWLEIVGRADHRHWFDWLEEVAGRPLEREVVVARRAAAHRESVGRQVVRPGVVELLEHARRSRLSVAVASSSSREWVEGHLRRLGLFEYFHAVRCRGDVARAKPAPDLYLSALEALGVTAAQAIAFEDSHHGSQAAKAAGIYTVVVPNDLTRTQAFGHADLVLESLADFPVRRYVRPGV
jgi:HAD superfamily hydrolase (TIGR01509 family)